MEDLDMNFCGNCKNFCYLYMKHQLNNGKEVFYKENVGRCFKHPNKNMQGRIISHNRKACVNFVRGEEKNEQ